MAERLRNSGEETRDQVDVGQLIEEVGGNEAQPITAALMEMVDKGAGFGLVGGQLMRRLRPGIRILDARPDFMRQKRTVRWLVLSSTTIGWDEMSLIELVWRYAGEINERPCPQVDRTKTKDVDLVITEGDINWVGEELMALTGVQQESVAGLPVIRWRGQNGGELTIVDGTNQQSFHVAPGCNLDIATAGLSVEKGRLIAQMDKENRAMIGGEPLAATLVDWQNLDRYPEKMWRVIARLFRLTWTVWADGEPLWGSLEPNEYRYTQNKFKELLLMLLRGDSNVDECIADMEAGILGMTAYAMLQFT